MTSSYWALEDRSQCLIVLIEPSKSNLVLPYGGRANSLYTLRPPSGELVRTMLNAENDAQPPDQVVSIDDIKQIQKKSTLKGIPLLFSFVFYLLLILLLDGLFPETLFLPGLVVAVGLTIVGLAVVAFSSNWNSYIRGIRRLQETEPPEVVVTKDYAVAKHMNTYIFVPKSAPMAIYFVALEGTNLSPATKVHVPRNFWKWDSSVEHIKGHRIHKRTGVFSIPTPERRIVSGEGVLYVLPFIRMSPRMVGTFDNEPRMVPVGGITKDFILSIAETVSKLISDNVSGDSSV